MEKEKNEQANQWFIDSFNDSFNSIQFNSFIQSIQFTP